jgi:DhnA family fructose-bisphosphate aldolase class Ia
MGMPSGKTLRIRRVFANGRAVIGGCAPLADDAAACTRTLARCGADAVILTPGLLDAVADELGSLAVVLRIDGGPSRGYQLASVQAALEMGADAVLASLGGTPADIERLCRIAEDSRRLGMPLLAEVTGPEWLEAARIAADCGADAIQGRFLPAIGRGAMRQIGKPLIACVGGEVQASGDLLRDVYDLLQGVADGIVISRRPCIDPALLEALQAIVHQGVTADEALAIVEAEGNREAGGTI